MGMISWTLKISFSQQHSSPVTNVNNQPKLQFPSPFPQTVASFHKISMRTHKQQKFIHHYHKKRPKISYFYRIFVRSLPCLCTKSAMPLNFTPYMTLNSQYLSKSHATSPCVIHNPMSQKLFPVLSCPVQNDHGNYDDHDHGDHEKVGSYEEVGGCLISYSLCFACVEKLQVIWPDAHKLPRRSLWIDNGEWVNNELPL